MSRYGGSVKRVTVQVPGRVVTVVGMYINVSSVKCVTVQVLGRVVTVVGMYINVSSVKRVIESRCGLAVRR